MIRIASLLSLTFLLAWTLPSTDPWEEKISPTLKSMVRSAEPIDFMVLLHEKADLSHAQAFQSKAEKATFVFNQLQATAAISQKSIIDLLNARGVNYRSFYIVNAIQAKGDLALIEEIAQQSSVAQVMYNPTIRLNHIAEKNAVSNRGLEAVEWGIEMINADDVWAMGYTGQGVVVGGADTGYEWFHPAIKNQYRGWDGTIADHNYNWHDAIHEISPLHNDPTIDPSNNPCGLNSTVPCDDHNHGTHTMGTMIGDDGADNQIGVAPGASWVACRNMERGYGSPSSYIECFEWFLAPTDTSSQNPDPTKAPHVINNSWSCPEMEGCMPDNWSLMETAVNNLRSSGVVVVVSAGNSGGQGCGSVSTPAAMFENSFTIGSTKSDDDLSGFSSRGPVTVDGSMRMKPDVAAPGSAVRSCVRDGGYSTFSGTSMAGPHVVGLVALLISANPALAGNVEEIEEIIRQSAVQKTSDEGCGEDSNMAIPNNKFGHGRVDALAAVNLALQNTTSTLEQINPSTVRVFPNPVNDLVQFEIQNLSTPISIEIYNAAGQLVVAQTDVDGTTAQNLTFPMIRFNSGVYFYRVLGKSDHFSGKFIKE